MESSTDRDIQSSWVTFCEDIEETCSAPNKKNIAIWLSPGMNHRHRSNLKTSAEEMISLCYNWIFYEPNVKIHEVLQRKVPHQTVRNFGLRSGMNFREQSSVLHA